MSANWSAQVSISAAFIVADSADFCPDYLDQVRAPGSGYLSIPFGDEAELSLRIR